MKLRLLFSMLLCSALFAATGLAQSVGIIGTAGPYGWDKDTNMVQNQDSAHLWNLKLNLNQGEAKFRLDDAWTTNWGAGDFPTGIGVQDGPNVPIPAFGEYTVDFNSQTGAYKFVYTSDIGIIGDATPGGWNDDTNMYHDQTDSNKYFITIVLTTGSVKFRANDAWTVNWGSTDFPTGVGVQDGSNIPITTAGKYLIKFDKSTGAYSFEEVIEFTSISLIGSATAGGWDTDTDLTKDNQNSDLWKGNVVLTAGDVKFRANHAWTLNWGNTFFPSGVGIPNGDNIPVPAGEYLVTFNTHTLEYNFLPIVIYTTVGIIGDATPGGWDTDTDLIKDATNPSLWSLRIVLKTGQAKFRAENDWTVNWGAGDFPTGVGTQDGANIPVDTGEYFITFNSITGDYNFKKLLIYSTVGLVGPSTPLNSWDVDVDMTKDAVDESFWFINSIDLTDGFVKFRAEDAWTVNWGLAQWPTGLGTQDGPNIPVTGGTYRVTLNSGTGEYAFTAPGTSVNLLADGVVSIAPNPVEEKLNIRISAEELQGELRVMLFDIKGAQVLSQTVNMQGSASLDVSHLQAGNYFLHVANKEYAVGKKIVVVR